MIISKIWQWLREADNRGALKIIGSAIAAIILAGWSIFLYFNNRVPQATQIIERSNSPLQSENKEEVTQPTSPPSSKPPSRKQQVGKTHFDITGCTDEERNNINRRLEDLNVKSASINVEKSEIDNSRNIYIQVTYQSNNTFTDSFNTPLANVSNVVISEIEKNRSLP